MPGPRGVIVLEQDVVGGVPCVEVVKPPSLGESLGVQGPAILHADLGRGLCDQPRENKVSEGGVPHPGLFNLSEHYGIARMHFQAVRMIDFHSEVLYSNTGTNALTIIFIDIGLAQGAVQMIVEGGIHGNPISFNIDYVPVIPNVVCMLFPMLLPYGIHPCPCGGMVEDRK